MKKSTKFLIFVYFFISLNLYAYKISDKVEFIAGNLDNSKYSENIFICNIFTKFSLLGSVVVPPTVTSPIYLCQNSPAVPLTATPSVGGTLNWYGTNATGGTASSTAPTPSTTTIGTTSYYVSETVGGVESTRSKIDVIVVADNGATIVGFGCDPSQVTTPTSVFFDWGNNPLTPNSIIYNYTYTILGGGTFSGQRTNGTTNLEVFGLMPGQSVTLTITSLVQYPCVPSQTRTCSVPCGATTVSPNFPAIAPFCSGSVAPALGNTSPNGITGTWSPAVINNTANGNYIFTPDPILFPCATTQTLPVTVTPLATPTFTTIPSTVCQNATAPVLPLSSSNATPISGIWSPAIVDMGVLGPVTYIFTPNSGQCTSATPTTASITVVPVVTPNFANIPPFCSGTTAPLLSNTSPNGIIGTWSPSIISNTVGRSYLFTPNANQCATTQTLNVTVIAKSVPNFAAIPAFCSGATAPTLVTTSPNGINGTWSPATINNAANGSYVFTPNATECATTQTLVVTINPLIMPNFTDFSICSGDVVANLNSTSPNGISGTWSPSNIVNTTTSASYTFTPVAGQPCAPTVKTINVTVNPSNAIVNLDWAVTDAFSKNQIVTVTDPVGVDYLYRLDDGPFQESPIFEYVSLGTHAITVANKNGCSTLTVDNVLVIDYPKYFTPNSDGFNDTWNIFSLEDQSNFRILIFDRFGKFLKEIRPKSIGWDGMYNGHPMPANDYWFSVEYAEQNIAKIFKSHFSLKR